MLSRRAYSTAEVRRALDRKFPGNPQVEEAIVRLRSLGYLDDRRFAEQLASSLVRNRGFGTRRLVRELKSRLADYRYIDRAVALALAETSERDLLEKALDKKLRTLRRPVTRARLSSLCQSLLRQGFRADDIMKAVRARRELDPVSENVESDEF
jgi:regulatory protein